MIIQRRRFTKAFALLTGLLVVPKPVSAQTLSPLRYVAILSQHGANDPTASVIHNTLSGTPEWSRVEAGYYKATLANGFPLGRTIVKVPTHQDSLDDYAGSMAQSDDSTIYVFSMIPTGALSDDCWIDRWVDITVYPEPNLPAY